ncbi:uncharacterized protein IL334_007419 [Kwoniella shivajii]|uniref:L-serine ammonia-lyase n=1 Tax=Kwoniella shivajii TaxID=564305 RepID=A0ABZ1D8L9_9TREE|nr:hypothetical protein IL334_007419 [Kwoniella shivajii]
MIMMPLTPPSESNLDLHMKHNTEAGSSCPCPWIETPLIESVPMSKVAGCRIFLKMENFQPSGSFKSRGIGNLVRRAVQRFPSITPKHFYASSGGNAGLACVTAATTLKQQSAVVVPLTTKPEMIQRIIAAGATEVIQHGATIADADQYLREKILPNDPEGVYVPPFDHQDIWDGAESLIHEVDHQMSGIPDAVVCSVGGGGLLIGICQGLDKISKLSKLPLKTQVIGVETIGCESFAESIKAKALITLTGITSIASSLGCTRVASRALEYGLRSNVHSTLVTDKEAVEACIRFAEDHKVLVEPACGATLALVYSGRLNQVIPVNEDDKVVLVVCGGSNVSVDMMYRWKEEFGI